MPPLIYNNCIRMSIRMLQACEFHFVGINSALISLASFDSSNYVRSCNLSSASTLSSSQQQHAADLPETSQLCYYCANVVSYL